MKNCCIIRHKTHFVKIGKVHIGNRSPIVIQSMTDAPTADIEKTVNQIILLVNAGAEIVRLTVDDLAAAKAVPQIKNTLLKRGYDIPLVGCFHYNGHTLLSEVSECAEVLDKYRINPGNVGFGEKRDRNFETIIKLAIRHNKPIRIGANWGSLDQDILAELMNEGAKNSFSSDEIMIKAMVKSVLSSAQRALDTGLPENMIILSAKVSKVNLLKNIYVKLANECQYALHLGLTEAGMGMQGIISTTAALTSLLQLGIGDTIRASITPAPGEPRTNEIAVCKEILQSLELKRFTPSITSCPGCGRTKSDAFKNLTLQTNEFIQSISAKYPGIENLKIAVMGCIVNGPGESKHANIGISLPGKGEENVAVVFIDGKKSHTLHGEIFESFKRIILNYVEKHYA